MIKNVVKSFVEVVIADEVKKYERMVNDKLSQGWSLHGNLQVIVSSNAEGLRSTAFIQQITKPRS